MTLRPWLQCVRKVLGTPARGHSRRHQQAPPCAAQMEQLESRQVLAASVTASLSNKGVLTIQGTENGDHLYVRQINGIASTFISVDNCQISVKGKMCDAVDVNDVKKIVIRGNGGDDSIALHVTDYDAVSIDAEVQGGTGNDSIWGGNGDDSLSGNAGQDYLWGYGGDDLLNGGTVASGGTVAERDYFWGGEGFDTYSDAFDQTKWTYQGVSVNDIQQEGSPTCQTLATLAAAVNAGINFNTPKITHLGGTSYSVRVYENGKAVNETVKFDGTWNDNDPSPSVDAKGMINPEFWTILMQRARLEHFYKVDSSQEMTQADWDKVNEKSKNGLYNVETAMRQMHGWKTTDSDIGDVSAKALAKAQDEGAMIVAGTPGEGKKKTANSTGIVSGHAYAVTNVFKDSQGKWSVQVYNPWGHDGHGTPRDGQNDGFLTLTWSEFTANFDHVTTAKSSNA